MPANPAAATDFDLQVRRGGIYRHSLSYRCTVSGRTLQRDGIYLFCPHCSLTVLSPQGAPQNASKPIDHDL